MTFGLNSKTNVMSRNPLLRLWDARKYYKPKVNVISFDRQEVSINSTSQIIITGEFLDYVSSVTSIGQTTNDCTITIISKSFNELVVELSSGSTVQQCDINLINPLSVDTITISVANIVFLIPDDGTTNWVRVSSNVSTSLGQIETSTTATGWNKAGSFGTVPSNKDFELEFDIDFMSGQTYLNAMIGVDNSDPNYTYTTIDYCFYLYGSSTSSRSLQIRENGTSRGNFGNWNVGDKLSIKRVGTTITYSINGNLLHTSIIASSSQMVFDCSLYQKVIVKNLQLKYYP